MPRCRTFMFLWALLSSNNNRHFTPQGSGRFLPRPFLLRRLIQAFIRLLSRFGPLQPPHNRQVEDGGPTYRRPLPFKSFWAHHFI